MRQVNSRRSFKLSLFLLLEGEKKFIFLKTPNEIFGERPEIVRKRFHIRFCPTGTNKISSVFKSAFFCGGGQPASQPAIQSARRSGTEAPVSGSHLNWTSICSVTLAHFSNTKNSEIFTTKSSTTDIWLGWERKRET